MQMLLKEGLINGFSCFPNSLSIAVKEAKGMTSKRDRFLHNWELVIIVAGFGMPTPGKNEGLQYFKLL